MSRARYRLSQFRAQLWAPPLGPAHLAEVRQVLCPPLPALFRPLSPGEQAHSLRVMRVVAAGGNAYAHQAELQQAALLHDVGKTLSPLTLMDRVPLALVSRLWPGPIARWAGSEPRGRTGSSTRPPGMPGWGPSYVPRPRRPHLTVNLVRRHQLPMDVPATREDEMLYVLQTADDDN
jgi:hypothetical protein